MKKLKIKFKIIERAFVIFISVFILGLVIWLVFTEDLAAEVQYKIELLQAVAVASVGLIGLNGIILIEIVRNEEIISQKLKTKPRDIRFTRMILSWSIVIGLATIMLVCIWFINGDSNIVEIAWVLFIIQVLSPFTALIGLNLLSLF